MNRPLQELRPQDVGIDRHTSAGAGYVKRLDRRRPEFVSGLPLVESESVQLGRGTARYLSRRIWGRDLAVLDYSVTPKLAVHSVPRRDWVVLLMPMNERADYVFNGRAARPFDLFLSAGPNGYTTTGQDRRNLAIGVRRTRLVSACSALAGVGPEDVELTDVVLPPEQDTGQRLRRKLIGVARPGGGEPVSPGHFAMPEAVENDLISMLAAQLLPALRRVPDANPFRVDALRVVRAATDAATALPAPSLAELCAAVGVSQRWLHKCFVDTLGVSPYRYLRLARLSKARDALLAPEARPALVKCLALSLGYRLSGRFAAEYRSVFGENPTDTLRGSRKD